MKLENKNAIVTGAAKGMGAAITLTLAREGALPRALGGDYDGMAQLTQWAVANAPELQTISVQAHPYHDGGGSAAEELGFAMATAVEYLREMQTRGLAKSGFVGISTFMIHHFSIL